MTAPPPELLISLIRDDALFRLQRRIGLIPENGLGLFRRAVFFALLGWLPIAVWAAVTGHALPGGAIGEPLLRHFGVHVRFLLAVPLLILGEGAAHALSTRLVPYFQTSGLVREDQRPQFRQIIEDTVRLRNSTLPWIILGGLIFAALWLQPPFRDEHELIWANVGEAARFDLGFGGWWMAYVARPIFVALIGAWLWRIVLLFVLLKRIAGLDLQIVPTHPDKAGGLGFLEKLPSAFSLFAFAISAVVASRLAHDVMYHGAHVENLKGVLAVFLILVILLCLAPLLVFAPRLGAARKQALLDYGALVGEHGRLVHRRWIEREPVENDGLLAAPELGPVADTVGLYEAVAGMRTVPVGKAALLSVALPAAIPMVALAALEIPVKDILLKILGLLA